MKHKYVRSVIVLGMLLVMVGTGVLIKSGIAQADNALVVLNSGVDPVVAQSQLVQAAPAAQPLAISLGLQLRNVDTFNSLLSDINDPTSSLYQQYLTPDQFTQEFAPTGDQVQQVVSYLQAQGMVVTDVAPDNLLLDVQGTVQQARQAFNVQMNVYRHGKDTFYANGSPVRVPARLRSLIAAVTGLDTSMKMNRNVVDMKQVPKTSPVGYAPKDIASAYDISPLQSAGFLGDRQTIALYELDGYQSSDVANYVQYYNPASLASIPASATAVPTAIGAVANLTNTMVDNYNGSAGAGAIETSLDIEMIDAIAPHANILVYEGPNTVQGINDTYSKIINDNRAQVLSTSWGLCETAAGTSELQLLDNLFMQAASQGMSVFAAAGDKGAYDCADTNLVVDSPASDPYVTGVGGTSLQLNANGTISNESVWSDTTNAGFTSAEGDGSGGGLSSYFAQPSWQRGSGVQNSYSNGKREVPDVTANADNNYGYAIYCTVAAANCPSTGWAMVGGTSASAPLWAASTLLINQYLQAQGKSRLGQINPVLYGLFNGTHTYPAFHDITTGNNLYYPATGNYDLASGLGSPDVFNIARDLVINAGGTAATSSSTATIPGITLAQDTFHGANQTYWGTSSSGQSWSGDANTSSVFSIASNSGLVTNGTTSYNATLGTLALNTEVSFTGSLNSYTTNTIGAVLHWTDGTNWYRAYLDGASLIVQKMVLGIPTVLAAAPFTATGNTAYRLRFRIVGLTLSAVAWANSGTEPSTWMIVTTDSTLLTGYSGLRIQELTNGTATFTAFQSTTAL
jgi:subtilase family serine protease